MKLIPKKGMSYQPNKKYSGNEGNNPLNPMGMEAEDASQRTPVNSENYGSGFKLCVVALSQPRY